MQYEGTAGAPGRGFNCHGSGLAAQGHQEQGPEAPCRPGHGQAAPRSRSMNAASTPIAAPRACGRTVQVDQHRALT